MNEKSRKMWQLVAILAINFLMLVAVYTFNAEAVRLGDSGERVAQIQLELKRKNLMSGEADGLFDFATKKAVSEFQRHNGIEKSGEADYKTLRALGINSHYSDCFSLRTELLARCIQLSGCRTYPEMLKKADEILGKADGAQTLGKYISMNFPDFTKTADEPSVDAYNAALYAIRKRLAFAEF